ncbi:general substrate transporter [Xylariaceae sp. FL0255]|nr:general substrate transporter [Xylariaceae sp. FL0255]
MAESTEPSKPTTSTSSPHNQPYQSEPNFDKASFYPVKIRPPDVEQVVASNSRKTRRQSVLPGTPIVPDTISSLAKAQKATVLAWILGLISSIGGFMFGYTSGQISGYFGMTDFVNKFGGHLVDGKPKPVRQGTITALLFVGALFGALIAGRLADTLGRRLAISVAAFWSCVGIAIEISSQRAWYQFALGRFVTSISIGALSVVIPMYQSESSPAAIRGALVSTYQLFQAIGFWVSYLVDWGTKGIKGSASWRIPNGLGFAWSMILGVGICFLPESPRYAYYRGRTYEARRTISRLAGVTIDDKLVRDQIAQIREKLEEEKPSEDARLKAIFKAPRMRYRTVLGVAIQSLKQLTGAHFLLYYGTTMTGLDDSYVTQIIFGTVNVIFTLLSLYVAQIVGRRTSLMAGAASMSACFVIYTFIGTYPLSSKDTKTSKQAGAVLIVFSSLAMAAYASTLGPIAWAAIGELYPVRYRAFCLGIVAGSGWFFNTLLAFSTRFIVDKIHFWFGLVFVITNLMLTAVVFFFLIEAKDRTLEEVDTMYLLHVNPIRSRKGDSSSKMRSRLEQQGSMEIDGARQ